MTTYSGSTFSHGLWGAASDAEYRAMGSACDAAITGAGLTAVSTTANWTSDTIPTTPAGTWGNYSIYKFNDGITPEIYLKVQWGRGSITGGAAGQFMIGFQISPDNSNWTTQVFGYFGIATADSSMAWDASFSDSCFVLVMDSSVITASWTPVFLVVERTRNYSDAANNTGAILLNHCNGIGGAAPAASAQLQGRRMKCSAFADASVTNYISIASGIPGTAPTVVNNIEPIYPTVAYIDEFSWNMRSVLNVSNAVVGTLSQLTATVNGTTRTYRTTRSTATSMSASGYRLAYRWE